MLPVDKATVLSIPISWSRGCDFLMWHFNKNGEYTVSSGYSVALMDRVNSSSSDPSKMFFGGNLCGNLTSLPKPDFSFGRQARTMSLLSRTSGSGKCWLTPVAKLVIFLWNLLVMLFSAGRSPPSEWIAPPPGLLKLNSGYASQRNSSPFGVGVAIRDNKGDSRFIVKDIKALFVKVGICKCEAIPGSGNSLAQNLASFAFSSVKESLWLDPNFSSVFYAV
ncbi:hypothetical protein Ddye_008044 [Dipteronia dyeriana]|uniref:Uncharacterized protein n=1 Tax=Dipteronia dyeriana TaxID=168575 RepID=A0AAD9X923_9ROSI|nr:hypothetical protein Ddye_008044 [Dipteronia dyeriana]